VRVSKKALLVGMLLFTVFISCFGFPVWNLEKQFGRWLGPMNAIMVITVYGVIGAAANAFFEEKRSFLKTLFLLVFVLLGMGCRYLLEFGEVSNTYNFTTANILLHLVVASFSFLTAKSGGNGEEN